MRPLRRVYAKRHGLMKCPNCEVYLVDPLDTKTEERLKLRPQSKFALMAESLMRKIRGEPHAAEELFAGAWREVALFDVLLLSSQCTWFPVFTDIPLALPVLWKRFLFGKNNRACETNKQKRATRGCSIVCTSEIHSDDLTVLFNKEYGC